ncbi:MutS-related protein [Ancylomarina longa]|uniref:DNA mismatch repair protein MutS n=1 Tax=Ancylomarina longa TaxID=2487017 RepID=A0A434AYE6_9BACT|nr:DNA mismatch repair protein MutS [Ancylomarina longa]RUT79560.1 DNA mismatch repair protein MutS [Ancylomarina longa]
MRKKKKIESLKESFGKLKGDDFHFDLIERYFRNKDNSDSFQVLSDKTCNDLDFEELFMFLDRTTSKIGQQCLYNRLRIIPNDSTSIDIKEKLIQKFSVDTDFRIRTQLQLDKLSKNDVFHISSLFQEEHAKPPKWFFVIRLLSFTSLLSLIMLPINPKLFFVFLGVFIVNIGFHFWNKRNLYKYLGSIPQLLKLNSVANNLHKDYLLKKIDPDLLNSIRIINQVRNRMSFFRLEANLQSESEVIFWGILELLKITFLIEPLLLFGVLHRLDSKRKEIENIFCFVGEIDILISTASLRSGLERFCMPVINDAEISATQVYHPLIPTCIPNSINVSDKSILLTGSNMSGKTTFIRTIGLNIITGLTINTCFADSMTFPRLRIYSAIRISDDLLNNKSYYFEEVLTIKKMIYNSSNGKPNLFLLDEIFKGTNTIERISSGKAVLSLLSKNQNIVFVSTHDIELTDMLSDEYELYHFSEIVKENNVDFDYKLKEGKLKNRNAIRILQINDYPNNLIDEAITISEKLDKITVANN